MAVMLDTNTLLTTAKAAKLLGTHESSVKRWCNDGRLASHATDGGHRRIEFDVLLSFAEQNQIFVPVSIFAADAKHIWAGIEEFQKRGHCQRLLDRVLDWTLQRELPSLVELFRYLGGLPEIPLQTIFDEILRPALYKVGEWWQSGEISISHEHIVSHTFQHGLYALNETRQQLLRRKAGFGGMPDSRAIVGCAEGNLHEIASFCVRSLLEAQGWEVYYLGANVPTVEFLAMQRKSEASLVCISYSAAATSGDAMRDVRVMRDLIGRDANFRLVLGGSTIKPIAQTDNLPFRELRTFNSATDFSAWSIQQ